MNYRSTLLAAGAAVALGGLASAQLNYSHNWNSLRSGAPALIFGPAFFDTGVNGSSVGIGDSVRYCYSIDITQGGRNESGSYELAWSYYAQAYGGNNLIQGIDLGPQLYHSQVSDDLGDDACFSAFFPQTGTLSQETSGFILPGVIAGTAGFPINAGFFWQVAFQFIQPLPAGSNTLGVDPVTPFAGTPLVSHFMFEVQGPVNSGPFNRQYFIASTSEVNGLNTNGSGGVTNGNNDFGLNLYGVTAEVSGAVAGARVTTFDEIGGLLGGGTVAFGTPGDLEFFGGVAFTTPNLRGVNSGNTGSGNADWTVTALPLSVIDIEVLDRFSGGQSATSGSAIANPLLAFNAGFILASATPALTTLQNALSWDDVLGGAPPKAGTYLLPPQATTRFTDNEQAGAGGGVALGNQTIHANFDATTSLFLSSGLSLLGQFTGAFDPNVDGQTGSLFDYGVGQGLEGTSTLGAIPLATPAPGAGGSRIGLHALILQVDVSTGGALAVAELTNAKTAVLQ